MTAARPAPTDAQVDAQARVLYEAHYGTTPGLSRVWEHEHDPDRNYWRNLARAALSSSVIGDLIAEAWDEGYDRGRQDHCDYWPSPDECDITSANPYRAAALSPTPADGTTSERSEA